MPLIMQRESSDEAVLRLAYDMAQAARTAPKANGYDRLSIAVIYGEEMEQLAAHMCKMAEEGRAGAHFVRDAGNLRASQACVLIGTDLGPKSSGCASCSFTNCPSQNGFAGNPVCAFACHDLGLAVGSAVSLAADRRTDNRVMYSVGQAAVDLGWLGENVRYAMGIPLCATGKSIYYDRPKIS
ncbi:MAG: DUF2148 domain-containing protein [Clostridia bacterium]|nr:DUF2148 domain-containing protein [Clostridia bacterium]